MKFGTVVLGLAAAATAMALPGGRPGGHGGGHDNRCNKISSNEPIILLEHNTATGYEMQATLTFDMDRREARGQCEVVADFEAYHPKFTVGGDARVQLFESSGRRGDRVLGQFTHENGKATKTVLATLDCAEAAKGVHLRINPKSADGHMAWTQYADSGIFLQTGRC